MHVLDANELFWITSYTYDRIMEVWWKQWPDAFALYFKLMKQARIQQTNQTYTLNSFLKDGMWWWTDRLRNAKNILKNLWLVDDVNVQDKKWKIIGHYVRVNYLIDEEKIRTAGITYNVSTCWLWPQMDENHQWTPATCGWTATNALSTKYINAWSTKIEKNCLSENKTTTSNTIPTVADLVTAYKNAPHLVSKVKDEEVIRMWATYKQKKKSKAYKTIRWFLQQLVEDITTVSYWEIRYDVWERLQYAYNKAINWDNMWIRRDDKMENWFNNLKKINSLTKKQDV